MSSKKTDGKKLYIFVSLPKMWRNKSFAHVMTSIIDGDLGTAVVVSETGDIKDYTEEYESPEENSIVMRYEICQAAPRQELKNSWHLEEEAKD